MGPRLPEKRASLQQDDEVISMQSTTDFDPSKVARSLLRRSRQGALATLMTGSGDPYCSLVNLASHPDGSPILLISRLAVHTRNLLADSRVPRVTRWRARGSCWRAAPRRRAAIARKFCARKFCAGAT
jgi:hypothetical protein